MPERSEFSVLIPAPPPQVVAVLADLESYPRWAEEVKAVDVLSTEGDGWADRVEFDLDTGVIRDHYVLDYDWQIAHDGTGQVTWDVVQSRALRRLHGSYTLSGAPSGTLLTYRLTLQPKVPMLGVLRRKLEQLVIDAALTGVRDRVIHLQAAAAQGGPS